jgi:perosamine synthetase
MIKVARASVGNDELNAINEVFNAGWIGMGNHTLRFEETIQNFLSATNVIAVNTGTSALHLAMVGLGLGPGDEVIVPSLTYVASFQAISMTGAVPVACESDPDTLLMNLDDAERRITQKTKAVMPVHYCGQACDMDRLLSWREKYGLRIIEDAAHAFGSEYKGRKIGSFGDVTCFSFDPIKVITCGDGGAIVTTDGAFAERVRNIRLLGVDRESEFRYRNERKWFYDVSMVGFRYHLSNINAAIGLTQIEKIGDFISRRREICRRYDDGFAKIERLHTLAVDYDSTAPFMYIVRVPAERREAFMAFLRDRDVETGIHYLPNHWHSLYQNGKNDLPVADQLGHEIVTLPLHYCLTDNEVEQVVGAVQEFFER